MIKDHTEVKQALECAEPHVLIGRMRRLKRASDLSYKGKELQEYAPNMKLTPFHFEFVADVEKIKARNNEKYALDAHKM
jgi:ubiquinol-cytochrome c reductase subunit 7